MKLIEVTIENILSIEKATIKFEDGGLVLIEGWNYDDQRANGAGKTAILNAISFALYDKVPRKITATELLRRGAKDGFCHVTVACGPGDADIWEVRRSRPKSVSFARSGTTVDRTQSEFEAALGLNYEQFLISMYSAQGTDSKFLYLNDTSKKDFLVKLLALNEFSSTKIICDNKHKIVKNELSNLNTKIATILSKSDAYADGLRNLGGSTRAELINKLHVFESILPPDMSQFLKVESQIQEKRNIFYKAKVDRSQYHQAFRKLNNESSSPICSECGTELDISEAVSHREKELKKLKGQIDECDEILKDADKVENLYDKLCDKRTKESKTYNDAQRNIVELRGLIKEIEAQQEIQDKIAALKLQAAKLDLEIASKNRLVEFHEAISAMCSPTGAPAYILDTIIDSFNEYVSTYVSLLWPNASYKLIAYRENGKGDITAKFSDQLYMNSQEVSIGSLSGGECKALSLCADFALLDIMKKHFGIDLNPIILDEPFDGLDSVGKEIVIDLLEILSQERQIVVIDHGSEAKTMFSKTILVEKRQGVSHVSVTI